MSIALRAGAIARVSTNSIGVVSRGTAPGSLPLVLTAVWQGIGTIGLSLTPGTSAASLLGELWESIWRAVPKKKTSHSKTRMRSSGKGLQDKLNINNCPACGKPKLAHTVCGTCFERIRKRWGREAQREL
ncbi:hypothetical protein PYCC9005_001268 [Savitreella phatthalungensis]